MIKFSVITCTYNSAEYLEKNILSVKNQAHRDFEHIFIDGNSSDGTIDIIRKYQSEFPDQVKLFQFKPQGISSAMNEGIKNSAGEYLIHLHSDDSFYDNNVLSDVFKYLQLKHNPDWIYGKINTMGNNKPIGIFPSKIIWQNKGNDFIKIYLLKFYNYIPHQAVFIKKDIFDKFGYFDESLKCGMDSDFWLRIKDKTNWLFFDRIISNFSLRFDSQSSGLKNKTQNEIDILSVQKRYLNRIELVLFNILRYLLSLKKNNYQK